MVIWVHRALNGQERALGYSPYSSSALRPLVYTVPMVAKTQEMPYLAATDRQRLGQLRKLGLEFNHFFDVGSSNAVWSNQVSEDFPTATFDLFEPLVDVAPAYQEKLAQRLARHHPRFRLHKVALGPECKKASFYQFPEPANSTALPLMAAPTGAQRIEVDMLTLDYAVQEFQLPVPEVIKIDTQGCELGVLQGGKKTLPGVQALLLECWLTRAYGPFTPLLVEVEQWLRGYGFYLWDLGNPWRDLDQSLVAQDCVFLNARCKASRLQAELSPTSDAGKANEPGRRSDQGRAPQPGSPAPNCGRRWGFL